jgi:crotonobetainyl-CoA:carnitine CoA-transferase CaiB-like acyl-CoA transferase
MLEGVRVIDLSQGIPGAYCTKLFADAWADVLKVEPPEGDPLRRWTASGADLAGDDGALFRYLGASKRAAVGGPAEVAELAPLADILVEDLGPGGVDVERLRRINPALVVISISPFGLTGPWADLPATEFTLQGWCGSTASRGTEERPPLHAGGRIGEWAAGVFAAQGGLAARRGAVRTGAGEHVDVSIFEALCSVFQPYLFLADALGRAPMGTGKRTVEVPSIVPTADGYVGFCTVTGQQFQDFLVMIEHPELLDDAALARSATRFERRKEFLKLVYEWTTQRTTDDIIELASAMRIPVAPIGDGSNVTTFDHFQARAVYVDNPRGFKQPRTPYSITGVERRPFAPAPTLAERSPDAVAGSGWQPRTRPEPTDPVGTAPLAGLRVIDFTAFWAGPAASQMLAAFGADVVKVESVQRADGMRFNSSNPGAERWWEYGSTFHIANAGKRSITLDLNRQDGKDLIARLIEGADVIIENFTPRVMGHFGLEWDDVKAINPRVILVRMPAFGLDGPWRDRAGFAQTMEQVSGMASITGWADNPPLIPRGPCDPISGMHANVGLFAALEEHDRTGHGSQVEVAMVEAVLNTAAEVEVEYSAYGRLILRDGNRGPVAAPQGVYPAEQHEDWVAIAVVTEDHWKSLRSLLGDPEWMQSSDLATPAGRRNAADRIDEAIADWTRQRDRDEAAQLLLDAGIPAAPLLRQPDTLDNPQLQYRQFYETVEHPMLGELRLPSMPFRFVSKKTGWLRSASPMLGQHNEEVLGGELGLPAEELDRLQADAVIGDRPVGT